MTGGLMAALRSVWHWLRAVSGDDAYERYCERQRRLGETLLSAREFYRWQLEHKYNSATPSRCC